MSVPGNDSGPKIPPLFYFLLAWIIGLAWHPVMPLAGTKWILGMTMGLFWWGLHRLAYHYQSLRRFFMVVGWLLAFGAGSAYYHARLLSERPHVSPPRQGQSGIMAVKHVLRPSGDKQRYYVEWYPHGRLDSMLKALVYTPDTLIPGRRYAVYLPASSFGPLPRPHLPYGFDYGHYLATKGIDLRIWTTERTVFYPLSGIEAIYYYPYHWHRRIEKAFDRYLNPRNKAIAMALLLGDRRSLDDETRQAFARAGVMHVLAISGLHVGILLMFLRFLLRPLRWHRKWLYHLLIMAVLAWYAWFTGFSASVVRAVVMFMLFQWAWESERPVHSLYIWGLTAFGLLVFNPRWIYDLGFLMSFAAVGSIILFYPLLKKLYYPRHRFARYLIDLIYIGIAAQVGVLPLVLHAFHRFSLGFLPANILVVPLLTLVLIAGFVSVWIILAGGTASWLLQLVNIGLELMWRIIETLSGRQEWVFEDIYFSRPLAWAWLVGIGAIYFGFKLRPKYRRILWLVAFLIVYGLFQWDRQAIYARRHVALARYGQKPALLHLENAHLTVYSDSSVPPSWLQTYAVEAGIREYEMHPLPAVVEYGQVRYRFFGPQKIAENDTIRADVLVLYGSPKIHLDLLLNRVRPRQVIFGPGNRVFLKKLWQKTLRQRGIPYRDLYDEGFVMLSDTLAPAGEP